MAARACTGACLYLFRLPWPHPLCNRNGVGCTFKTTAVNRLFVHLDSFTLTCSTQGG